MPFELLRLLSGRTSSNASAALSRNGRGVVRLGQALDLAEPACWAVAPERCSFHVHDAVALVQTSYGRPRNQRVARVDPNLADPDHGCLWVLLIDGDLGRVCSAHVPGAPLNSGEVFSPFPARGAAKTWVAAQGVCERYPGPTARVPGAFDGGKTAKVQQNETEKKS